MTHEPGPTLTPSEALGRVRLGAGLGEAGKEKLAAAGRMLDLEAGATVFREGEKTPVMGVVVAGRLGIRTHVAGRGDVNLATVEQGDIFGWSVLVPPHRAHSTLWAVSDVTLLVFDAEPIRETLEADPDLAIAVLQHALRALDRRLGATRLQLLDLFDMPVVGDLGMPGGGLSRRLADVRSKGGAPTGERQS